MIIDNAPSLGFVIKEVFMFVVVDKDGDESVPAIFRNSTWIPMVAADPARVDSFRDAARILAKESGKVIKLVRFTERTDLEVIEP